jgi:hypothetical protein
MEVRESQIEDVLTKYPDITKELLGITDELTLLARQKILPSGNKLDLLFVSGTRLKLIELKISIFERQFIKQIVDYKHELFKLQSENKLVNGPIDAYLLCPSIAIKERQECLNNDVYALEYSPENILTSFFARLRGTSTLITLRPADHGLWSIHLLNRLLYVLENIRTRKVLSKQTGLSESTIGSYLRLAQELHLIEKKDKESSLTDLGKKYVWSREPRAPEEHVSDDQAKVLQDFIIKDPFASRVILGIYTIVEVIFNLAKNTYPVPLDMVISNFRDNSGKFFEWSSSKSASDGTKMYSNYATELGLIAHTGDKFYITPDGVKFILLLQLHKAMQVIDSLGILG